MNRKSLLLTLLMALFAPWVMYGQGTTSMTVYDGLHSNDHIPAYIYYFDDFTRSQFVIPAEDLETLGDGAVISAVTFYADQAYPASGKVQAPVDVYLKEVNYTSISAFEATSSATTVYSGVLATGDGNVMTITFTNPYTYHNGNLLIGIENTEEQSWQNVYFYGQNVTGASVSGSGSSLSGVTASQQNFIPKTTFTYIPGAVSDCVKPTLGEAENITTESASFQWTENGNATMWELQYSTNADFSNHTAITCFGTPACALTGLLPGTGYYVHVRSYCGDGQFSFWSHTVSFRTICDVHSLPYFYSFEDVGELECWNLVDCDENTGITTNLSYVFSGAAAFHFFYNTTPPQYLISPEFAGTSMLFMSFNYMNASDSWPETFQVGYSTTTDATDAFTWGDEITANDANNWKLYENIFPRGTKFVAIKLTSNDKYLLCLDDFYFEVPITCFSPSDFAAADITCTTATLSWNDDEAEGYELEYRVNPVYHFENDLQGWTNLIVEADGGQWLHSSENPSGHDYTEYAHSGTGFALCYSYRDLGSQALNTDAYLVSPCNYQMGNDASLNFWYDMREDHYPEPFEVCVATVAHPTANDFTPIWNLPTNGNKGQKADARTHKNTRYNNWREVTVDLSAYAGQTIWIAFHDATYDGYEVWIDDVVINGCSFPWTPAPEPIASPYTLRGLNPDTNYEVHLRAICDEYEVSLWTSITFETLAFSCAAPSELEAFNLMPTSATLDWTGYQGNYEIRYRTAAKAPFFEDCESGSHVTNGWTVLREGEGNSGNDWHICQSWMSDPAHSGDYYFVGMSYSGNSHQLISVDNWLITPWVVLDDELSYWVRDDGEYHEHYDVYVSTTTIDTSAFTLLYEPGDASHEWIQHTVDLSSFAGRHGYIAFRLVDSNKDYLLIDDISIGSFDAVPAGEWITVSSSNTTVDITGLESETTYEWQVRGINPDCDGGMTEWSEVATFNTLSYCANITNLHLDNVTPTTMTLSWTGIQESYLVQYRTSKHLINKTFNDTADEQGEWTTDNLEDGTHNVQGLVSGWNTIHGYFTFVYTTNPPQTLISPQLTGTASNSFLEFDYAIYDATYPETFKVGFSTTDNNVASFTWGNAITAINRYFLTYSVSVPDGAKYFAIQYTSNDAYALILDNFTIGQYAEAGEWHYITVDEPTVTLTGLTPETKYDIFVRGICGDDEYTDPISGYAFTLEQSNVDQTIQLASGINWVSFYVDINLDALKAALVAAMPVNGVAIAAQNDGRTTYNGGRWRGALSALDLSQMYKITVPEACEITVEGMPIDPAMDTVTIRGGLNWIAFPLLESMKITDAFAGFATNGDLVKSMNDGQTAYNGTRWRGALNTLAPGKGYIYNSAVNGNRTFVFPSSAKAIKPAVIPMGKWPFGE